MNLLQVHRKALSKDYITQEFHLRLMEYALLQFGIEATFIIPSRYVFHDLFHFLKKLRCHQNNKPQNCLGILGRCNSSSAEK
jgi:hypothetical protein